MAKEDTFGGRLEEAIWKYGPRPANQPGARGSVKGFHEIIRNQIPAGAGTSYQTLYRVLSNEAEPSPEFIEAVLDALPQVRREWLLEHDGEMAASEEQVEEVVRAARPTTRHERISDTLAASYRYYDNISPHAQSALLEAWRHVARFVQGPALAEPRDDLEEMFAQEAAALGKAVEAPLEILELGHARTGRLDAYTILVSEAISGYVRERYQEEGGFGDIGGIAEDED